MTFLKDDKDIGVL